LNDRLIQKRKKILEGNLWSLIILLTIPVAANNLINALYSLIDAYFVSSIGTTQVASITFTDPIITFFNSIGIGVSVASTAIISRKIGQGDMNGAKNNIMQSLLLMVFMGIFISLICSLFAVEILNQASATDSILRVALSYFRLQLLLVPLNFINALYIGIKRAEGSTMKALIVNFISIIIKIICSYIFIIKWNMGITSLAYATMIALIVVVTIALLDIFSKKSGYNLNLRKLKIDFKSIYTLFIFSLPVIIEKSSMSFSFIAVNKYIIKCPC